MKNKKLVLFLCVFLCTVLFFIYNPIAKKKCYHMEVPLKRSLSNTPAINVKIENKIIPIFIDTGDSFDFFLFKDVLDNIKKRKQVEDIYSMNIRGNVFRSFSYKIPEININNLLFKNVIIGELPKKMVQESKIYTITEIDKSRIITVGRMGLPLIKKHNMLFDFLNEKIYFSNNLDLLHAEGYDLSTYAQIPFSIINEKIEVSITTDLGVNRFILDTGSTDSILQSFSPLRNICKKNKHDCNVVTTNTFKIGNNYYPNQELLLIELPPFLSEFDGILGISFFKDKILYLDFEKSLLYLFSNNSIKNEEAL